MIAPVRSQGAVGMGTHLELGSSGYSLLRVGCTNLSLARLLRTKTVSYPELECIVMLFRLYPVTDYLQLPTSDSTDSGGVLWALVDTALSHIHIRVHQLDVLMRAPEAFRNSKGKCRNHGSLH